MTDATDVFAAAAALIRDNYASSGITGLTVAWGNEAGEEGDVHLRVHDGTSAPVTVDHDGGSDETIIMQVDCVTKGGTFTATNRAMVKWLTGLFAVGTRVGPGVSTVKPYPVAPDNDDVWYWVPVTLTFRLLT